MTFCKPCLFGCCLPRRLLLLLLRLVEWEGHEPRGRGCDQATVPGQPGQHQRRPSLVVHVVVSVVVVQVGGRGVQPVWVPRPARAAVVGRTDTHDWLGADKDSTLIGCHDVS